MRGRRLPKTLAALTGLVCSAYLLTFAVRSQESVYGLRCYWHYNSLLNTATKWALVESGLRSPSQTDGGLFVRAEGNVHDYRTEADVELIRRETEPGERTAIVSWYDWAFLLEAKRPPRYFILPVPSSEVVPSQNEELVRATNESRVLFVDKRGGEAFLTAVHPDWPRLFDEAGESDNLVLYRRRPAGSAKEYDDREVPLPLAPAELYLAAWKDGTAECAGEEPPYLLFALDQPTFVRTLRLTCAYPAADGPSRLSVFWRDSGRNAFTDEERFCRLELGPGPEPSTVTVPVNDTITEFRLYPDDTQRGGGYNCVFRLERMTLLARPGDRERLLARYREWEYGQLVRQVRRVVCEAVPPGAAVLVAGDGDEELVDLEGRRGWQFPQTEEGVYAGHRPADSAAAVKHLEELRAKGAGYLVFPATSFWWLEHYKEFKAHLDGRYRCVWGDDHCVIYHLAGEEPG